MKVIRVRYAIYFTPAENDDLTRKASQWLGRNAFTGALYDLSDAQAGMVGEPQRYGFHATLKAPFELATGRTEEELISALEVFAASRPHFDLPDVTVGNLGPFFALVPSQPHQPLQDFAADVVSYFEPFRAPLSESDIARRRPQHLSASQRQNLMQWGYPHVMDDFRFHMTLTGPIDEANRGTVGATLATEFSKFTNRPLHISGLGLFVEQARGEPFTVQRWVPLAGTVDKTGATLGEKVVIS